MSPNLFSMIQEFAGKLYYHHKNYDPRLFFCKHIHTLVIMLPFK